MSCPGQFSQPMSRECIHLCYRVEKVGRRPGSNPKRNKTGTSKVGAISKAQKDQTF